MTRPRILRLLGIIVSAVCGILCLALIALWVRSFWWWDTTSVRIGGRIAGASSVKQHMILAFVPWQPSFGLPNRWSVNSRSIAKAFSGETEEQIISQLMLPRFPGFSFRGFWAGYRLVVPHWFFVSVIALLATLPWLPWSNRFSLRTLLLATTLVAVVLGLVVAMR